MRKLSIFFLFVLVLGLLSDPAFPQDTDSDGVPNDEDNCPLLPNGSDLGICTDDNYGYLCMSDEDCGINGFCNMNQEYICNCKSSFDCDLDVDGTDVAMFKAHFGRSLFNNPCTNEDVCNGDFSCDGDVDGSDTAIIRADFGRSFCRSTAFCLSPCLCCVEGNYVYECTY